jgi:uncharacterized DUF497 family protein
MQRSKRAQSLRAEKHRAFDAFTFQGGLLGHPRCPFKKKKDAAGQRAAKALDTVHKCAYNVMRYQWDKKKAASNFRKHGVYFADAVSVFSDEQALTIEDDCPEERRWVTLGRDLFGRILVVIYGWRDDEIRIISARKASPSECRQYGKKPGQNL